MLLVIKTIFVDAATIWQGLEWVAKLAFRNGFTDGSKRVLGLKPSKTMTGSHLYTEKLVCQDLNLRLLHRKSTTKIGKPGLCPGWSRRVRSISRYKNRTICSDSGLFSSIFTYCGLSEWFTQVMYALLAAALLA